MLHPEGRVELLKAVPSRCVWCLMSSQEGCGNLHENGLSAGSAQEDGEGQVESRASQHLWNSLFVPLSLAHCPVKSSCLGLLNSGGRPSPAWVPLQPCGRHTATREHCPLLTLSGVLELSWCGGFTWEVNPTSIRPSSLEVNVQFQGF